MSCFFLDKLESLKEPECLTVSQGVETGFIFTDNSKCCLTVLVFYESQF